MSTGIIWARVSSAEQAAHGYSLDAQVDALKDAAAHFRPKINVLREFKVQESASRSRRRKHFVEMVNFVQQNEVDYIVALKIDRLARNYRDFFAIQDLIDNGVTIFIVNDNKCYNKQSSPSERFHFRTMGNVAQLEAEMIGERTLFGMGAKFAAGGIPFMCPIGYLPVPDPADPSGKRRTIVVDPVRGPLVRECYEIYAAGDKSLSETAKVMADKGLTSRPALTWPKAGRGPRKVGISALHKILCNTFYYGEVKWGGKTTTGSHEPLIPKSLFNQVQRLLNKNCTYRRPDSKKFFLFRGLVYCGRCWKPMKTYVVHGAHKSGDYTYYHCRRKDCSNHRHYPESVVAQLVEEEITNLCVPPALAKKIKASLAVASSDQTAADKATETKLKKRETMLLDHNSQVYDDKLARLISAELYQKKSLEIETALAEVRADLERLAQPNTSFREDGDMLVSLLRDVKSRYLKAAPETQRRILSIMLEKAVFRPGDEYLTWREPFATLQDMVRLNQENRVSAEAKVG